MMNMFRRLKRKKGFTLTELIVSVAIIALLMACVAAFAQPVRSMMTGVRSNSDSLKICEIIGNYLERRVAYADKVKVFVGYDITSDEVTDMLETTDFAGEGTGEGVDDTNYTKGMLVMHLVKSPDGDEKNTFMLYDVPIKKGTTMPASLDDYGVFTDEFYDSYQFFMTTDEKMSGTESEPQYMDVNTLTHKAFFSFRIMGYKFKDFGAGISDDVVKNYYKFINTGKYIDGTNEVYEDPTDKELISGRTAVENVSFSFENISIKQEANGLYNNFVDAGQVDVHRQDTSTDVIIFYRVKTYKSFDIDATT